MKKNIIAIAVMAVATLSASSAFAASKDDKKCSTPDCTKKECKADTQCDKKGCLQAPCPFADLNMTAEQQTKLQALQTEVQQQKQAKREELKSNRDKAREEGKKYAQDSRKDYLAKVKAILTPEQYVQFLENSYLNAQPGRQKSTRIEGRADMHRGDKSGNHNRPARKLDQKPGEKRQ